MWRVFVDDLVGDIFRALELYFVEPVGEHGWLNIEDDVVAPAREPAISRVLVPVVGRELVCGVIEHPCVHVLLARAVGVLVRVRLKVGEAQLQYSPPIPILSLYLRGCACVPMVSYLRWLCHNRPHCVGIPALLAYRLPVWYDGDYGYYERERPRGACECSGRYPC